MSRIRSKWTAPEREAHGSLKSAHVPHRMHPDLPGNPDVLLRLPRRAVFINGCFWHGCARHFRVPRSNRAFWAAKIARNARIQARSARRLRAAGIAVSVIWEHDDVAKRIVKLSEGKWTN